MRVKDLLSLEHVTSVWICVRALLANIENRTNDYSGNHHNCEDTFHTIASVRVKDALQNATQQPSIAINTSSYSCNNQR